MSDALDRLLRLLADRGYRFVTPTPATHARIVARPAMVEAHSIRDVLGWSLPFPPRLLDDELHACLAEAGALNPVDTSLLRATIRVSSLDDLLFIHSAYPTDLPDAVFFGPDSYRFASLIAAELDHAPLRAGARIVDIGAGAGVGAIVAARCCDTPAVTMVDINPTALDLARINARFAGVDADFVLGETLDAIAGPIDLAVANPPYLIDESKRAYRDGGGMHGTEIALTMAEHAVARLSSDGRLILYTGSAIIDGGDPLRSALERVAARAGRRLRYRELDPDVFGEELDAPAYADVERIALVAAIIEPA